MARKTKNTKLTQEEIRNLNVTLKSRTEYN